MIEKLTKRIDAMPMAGQLIVAAQLLSRGGAELDEIAIAIAENVVMKYRANQLLASKP